MLASEFISTFAFATITALNGQGKNAYMDAKLNDIYQEKFFIIPRIVCKDGFSISIQVHNGAYCESENGYREFGYEWKKVEWGFPSQDIDAMKYNAENRYNSNPEGTTETVGSCEIALIDKLIEEHGGIDLMATLKKEGR